MSSFENTWWAVWITCYLGEMIQQIADEQKGRVWAAGRWASRGVRSYIPGFSPFYRLSGRLTALSFHQSFNRSEQLEGLGKVSKNQNGNLRWHLPLGARPPPPLMAQISRHFFTSLFFLCNWILNIWNRFYTWSQSKISFLSPLIIGSKLAHTGIFSHTYQYCDLAGLTLNMVEMVKIWNWMC